MLRRAWGPVCGRLYGIAPGRGARRNQPRLQPLARAIRITDRPAAPCGATFAPQTLRFRKRPPGAAVPRPPRL